MTRPLDNTDDLIEQMEVDELADAAKLSPRDFAKMMGMQPQLVYYYIRTGVIKKETCLCGRPVVDVEASKAALQAKAQERRDGIRREPDETT